MSALDQLASQVRAAGRGFRRPAVTILPGEDYCTIRVDDRRDGTLWAEVTLSTEVLVQLLALSTGCDPYGDEREWDAGPEAEADYVFAD